MFHLMGGIQISNVYELFKDIVIPFLGAIGGIISCFIAYKVYFHEQKPKIAIDYSILKNNYYDKNLVSAYLDIENKDDYGVGYNYSNIDHANILLSIKNIGTQPIIDLDVIYIINTYKYLVGGNIEEGDCFKAGKEHIDSVQYKIHIDYLPPQKEFSKVIFISDIIPAVKIDILKVKCKDKNFHKKKFTIVNWDAYDNADLMDGTHIRRLLGVKKS